MAQLTTPTYYRPSNDPYDASSATISDAPLNESSKSPSRETDDDATSEEWVLVDSTPATCVQLGLYHFFRDKEPVDLVISGPNYGEIPMIHAPKGNNNKYPGRNSTSLFSLSSGTIGGALEAAVCRRKAIALSFAFYSRDHDPKLIDGACKHSVRLIEHLYSAWNNDVDLYSINVPLVKDVGDHKVMYTNALQNYWSSGSSFQEVEGSKADEDPQKREQEIRQDAEESADDHVENPAGKPEQRQFKWMPKFVDIHKSVEESEPGNDGWAIGEGFTR